VKIDTPGILLTTLAMTGCVQAFGPGDNDPEITLQDAGARDSARDSAPDISVVDASAWTWTQNLASVVDAHLEGEFGAVRLDGETCWVHDSSDPELRTSLRIDIRCRSADGVLMNRLQIGNWRELQVDATNQSGDGAGTLSALWCSGPEDDRWLTDKRTQDVTLFVTRDSSARTLHTSFAADFEGTEEATQGAFTMPY
jgi:hypothetical protein